MRIVDNWKSKSANRFLTAVTLLVLFLACNSNSTNDSKDLALTEAKNMADAMMNNDFDRLVEYMHPKVINQYGGRDSFILRLRDEMNNDPLKYLSIDIEAPENMIKTESSYQCVIQQTTVLFDGQDKFTDQTPLIGIAYFENDKRWYFIQASSDFSKIQAFFPEISDELKAEIIPKKNQ